MAFINAQVLANRIIRRFIPDGVSVYALGPTPDFKDSMVVYQVVDVEPFRQGKYALDAVDFNLSVHCFHRDPKKAYELASQLVMDIHSAYMGHEKFSDGVSSVHLTRVEIVTLPVQGNDELVNDQQIYRFNFNIDVIARRC